jgi:hypothetical protein
MVWLLILLIYWPGIIGNVNINEINNLFAGNLDNWHPVIFTLLVSSSTKLFSTLTSFLIFQIVCLGAVIGWGFSFLESKGVKKNVLWVLTIVFAILPSNFVSIISLTDDIPYSIALLAITIMLLKIVDSDGAWLKDAKNMAAFALLTLFASTLRYNGIPAIGFTLFCVLLFFPNFRKNALKLIGIIIIGYLLINGPLFDVIGVNRTAEGHFDNILLHHISAHIDANVFLDNEQKEYLNSLLPLNEWSYSCCTNSRMIRKPDFNKEKFYANPSLNKKIALDLLIQSPTVNLDHILCASDMVWNITGNCEVAYSRMKTIRGNYYWTNSESPEYAENSKLPSLVEPLSRLWIAGDKNQWLNILIWRPAIYLYLSILSVLIFYLRNKNIKSLIILSPIIGQSAFLFAFNRIQNFRYQYCAVLIGLFLLGLVFIPRKSNID